MKGYAQKCGVALERSLRFMKTKDGSRRDKQDGEAALERIWNSGFQAGLSFLVDLQGGGFYHN